MLNLLAIAQAAPGRGMTVMLIYLVSFGLIAYFILIRPQRKMHEKHQAVLAGLKKGDEVMTEGGIIGTIVHVAEDRVTVKSGENTRIVVARGKVSRVLNAPAAERA